MARVPEKRARVPSSARLPGVAHPCLTWTNLNISFHSKNAVGRAIKIFVKEQLLNLNQWLRPEVS